MSGRRRAVGWLFSAAAFVLIAWGTYDESRRPLLMSVGLLLAAGAAYGGPAWRVFGVVSGGGALGAFLAGEALWGALYLLVVLAMAVTDGLAYRHRRLAGTGIQTSTAPPSMPR
ncbi:MAG TPA: hypothetical protein VNQ77_05895 [Frankiaceae bacterium]|nr:hypothetical protein [Frankiaceae bacterium]